MESRDLILEEEKSFLLRHNIRTRFDYINLTYDCASVGDLPGIMEELSKLELPKFELVRMTGMRFENRMSSCRSLGKSLSRERRKVLWSDFRYTIDSSEGLVGKKYLILFFPGKLAEDLVKAQLEKKLDFGKNVRVTRVDFKVFFPSGVKSVEENCSDVLFKCFGEHYMNRVKKGSEQNVSLNVNKEGSIMRIGSRKSDCQIRLYSRGKKKKSVVGSDSCSEAKNPVVSNKRKEPDIESQLKGDDSAETLHFEYELKGHNVKGLERGFKFGNEKLLYKETYKELVKQINKLVESEELEKLFLFRDFVKEQDKRVVKLGKYAGKEAKSDYAPYLNSYIHYIYKSEYIPFSPILEEIVSKKTNFPKSYIIFFWGLLDCSQCSIKSERKKVDYTKICRSLNMISRSKPENSNRINVQLNVKSFFKNCGVDCTKSNNKLLSMLRCFFV